MAIQNPIQYISRTFLTILNDINSDDELIDKPVWFKRIWAGVGDVCSLWINAEANNLRLRTSFTRNSVKDLVELIDYILSPHTTSSGDILFYVKTSLGTGIYPFTVAREDLSAQSLGSLTLASKKFEARGASLSFAQVSDTFTTDFVTNNELTVSTDFEITVHRVRLSSTSSLPSPLVDTKDYYLIYVDATHVLLADSLADAYAGNEISLIDDGTGTHTVDLFSKKVSVYQQETREDIFIGTSDGSTEWQEFDLPDELMLEDELVINVDGTPWTRVETFIDSVASSEHYKIFPKEENSFAIRFGNDIYGKIPGVFDITSSYAFGGGSDSNVTKVNSISAYSGSDANIDGVSNPQSITGGSNEESIESAKRLAPLLLKARNRFVTVGDGEALSLSFGGISQVDVIKNAFGVLSANVLAVANGSGLYVDTADALKDYLINRTVLEEMDIRVNQSASLTSINVTSSAKILPGYIYSEVEPFFDIAWKLFLSEAGQEIFNSYDSDGIVLAIELINIIFSSSFSTTDQSTLDQMIRLIENLNPVVFGRTFNESDAFGYIDSFVNGVDYIEIASFGTGFPLVLAQEEISTPGTISLSEIV